MSMSACPARAGWSVGRTVIAPPWQSGTEKTLRGTRAAGPARSILVGASRSSSLDVFTLHQRSPFAAAVAAALAAVGIAGAGIARREVLTPPWRRPGPPAPLKRRRIQTCRVDQPSVTGWPGRIALSTARTWTGQRSDHRTAAAHRANQTLVSLNRDAPVASATSPGNSGKGGGERLLPLPLRPAS